MPQPDPVPDALKAALRKMGYRPYQGTQIWAKPVAYHLLAVFMEHGVPVIHNYFNGADGRILTWDRARLEGDDPEAALKTAEYSTRLDVGQPGHRSDLAFLTRQEQFENLL